MRHILIKKYYFFPYSKVSYFSHSKDNFCKAFLKFDMHRYLDLLTYVAIGHITHKTLILWVIKSVMRHV